MGVAATPPATAQPVNAAEKSLSRGNSGDKCQLCPTQTKVNLS